MEGTLSRNPFILRGVTGQAKDDARQCASEREGVRGEKEDDIDEKKHCSSFSSIESGL